MCLISTFYSYIINMENKKSAGWWSPVYRFTAFSAPLVIQLIGWTTLSLVEQIFFHVGVTWPWRVGFIVLGNHAAYWYLTYINVLSPWLIGIALFFIHSRFTSLFREGEDAKGTSLIERGTNTDLSSNRLPTRFLSGCCGFLIVLFQAATAAILIIVSVGYFWQRGVEWGTGTDDINLGLAILAIIKLALVFGCMIYAIGVTGLGTLCYNNSPLYKNHTILEDSQKMEMDNVDVQHV
jgi:hypothetical protein